ncbi:unnamed protein product [Zymoseptoria tritici ST99CH_1A5]|nr:unnamed protein product [Zymoseptoria tritici ST99CH_3D7]SMR58593.1 unnamed protein product [Zymoseptoria tritici ST99CH_1E4]SMR61587.1 unnamed protein product [Zymoseptoria tritici ST99CH_3D1]SMY27799.1 unnamed protein product [Zymoseptoria tritici ST99CH_1A5]
MSRGSCTDKDWKDEACATVCTQGLLNFTAPITPCSDNGTSGVFACGLNTTACRRPDRTFTLPSYPSVILRASELSALASPAVSSALANAPTPAAVTVTATPSVTSDPNLHTSAEMAGLAVGLAIPLLISLAFCFSLYRREQSRTPKLMYPLPDNMEDPYTMKDGRSLSPFPFARSPSTATSLRPPVSRDGSEISAMTGMAKKEHSQPGPMHTFQDRYHLMKSKSGGLQVQRVELDASPEGMGEEFEEVEMDDVKVKPREQF